MTESGRYGCPTVHPSLGPCNDNRGHDGRHHVAVWGGACWFGDNPQHSEDYEYAPWTVATMGAGRYRTRLHVVVDPREGNDD